MVTIILGQYIFSVDYDTMSEGDAARLQEVWLNLSVLAGGFIITSLIWASALAMIVDRRFNSAAICFALGGILILFGIIHSPLPGDEMFFPWDLDSMAAAQKSVVIQFTISYFVMAVIMFALAIWSKEPQINTDEEFDKLSL